MAQPTPIAQSPKLLNAAEKGRVRDVATLLAEGYPVDGPRPRRDTPLMIAAKANDLAIVRLLIKAGAVVDRKVGIAGAAIHQAASSGAVEVVQTLIAAGARLEIGDLTHLTPLMRAAAAGHVAICDMLIDAGANVNAASIAPVGTPPELEGHAETALMLAVQRRHADVVQLLLSRGADRAMKDAAGRTAVDLAGAMNAEAMVAQLKETSGQ